MEQFWQFIDGGIANGGAYTPESVILSLVLAFALGQVLAWVYYTTHSGLSYSKTYVQSLVLITVVVSMVMVVIGSNIVTALGLMGALAIIRFRNIIKDTRDIAFIFCCLVVGMAAGSQRYAIAIIGTVFLSLIAVYLHITGFGTHQPHNGFLRFNLVGPVGPDHPLPEILKQFCNNFTLISVQDASLAGAAEYSYQLMIRDYIRNEEMLFELEKLPGINNITLTMQEELLEV
jgi:uncharacterized membrane protein YhiD involved in acid resistance